MKFHLILCLYFLSIIIFSSADNALHQSLVQCLAKKHTSYVDISKIVYAPNNPSFTDVLQSYIRNRRFSRMTTRKPNFIITPTTEQHVSAAVFCAKTLNILLKIRSGGHDYEGTSYVSDSNFTILDMFNFRSVDVSINHDATAWVGSGAILGELYYKIWEKSKVHGFPGGVCPTAGVGGLVSGGGYGVMLRKYGLAVDQVIDARIVDSNGAILNRSSMGEDLFWAIRGGGGASFCVILAYKVTVVPVPAKVTVFRMEKLMSSEAVYQYQQIVPTMDKELFIRVLLEPVKTNNAITVRTTFVGMFLGNSDQLLKVTDRFFPKLGLRKLDCRETPWINAVLFWADFDNSTSPTALVNRKPGSVHFLKRKSDYVKKKIPIPDLEKIFQKMIDLGTVTMYFNSYGGRMSEIREDETPFPHRAGNLFKIQYKADWEEEDKETEKKQIHNIRELYKFMEGYVSKNPREAYFDYRDSDIGITDNGEHSYQKGEIYGIKYFKKPNFDRLVKIKTTVDPGNFFRNEQSIPTLSLM